jgi:hypothetical protein
MPVTQESMNLLVKEIQILEAKLAAAAALKAAGHKPRKLTPEMAAAAAKRAEFELVELAEVGTVDRLIQDLPRLTQVDAAPKLLRMMKHRHVAGLIVQMINQVVEDTERTFMDVLEEATTRQSKGEKIDSKVEVNEAEKTLLALLEAEQPAKVELTEEQLAEIEARKIELQAEITDEESTND